MKILNVFIVIVLSIAICFVLGLGGLGFYKFFAPKREAVRREVFEETRSYNQGKMQELAKLKLEYEMADINSQRALKSAIVHKFADYNDDRMPSELEEFLTKIRGY